MITIALSKGRIYEETKPLLEAAGIVPSEDPEVSRKLILPTGDPGVRVIIVRASDVPTYVQYGAADLGVAGRDLLIEHGGRGLYQPLDLGIARCRMMVAVPEDFDYPAAVRKGARLRVATKYIQTAREHFSLPHDKKLILFGAYRGTVRDSGFHWGNPFYSNGGRQPGSPSRWAEMQSNLAAAKTANARRAACCSASFLVRPSP